jgi:hypothetical protein
MRTRAHMHSTALHCTALHCTALHCCARTRAQVGDNRHIRRLRARRGREGRQMRRGVPPPCAASRVSVRRHPPLPCRRRCRCARRCHGWAQLFSHACGCAGEPPGGPRRELGPGRLVQLLARRVEGKSPRRAAGCRRLPRGWLRAARTPPQPPTTPPQPPTTPTQPPTITDATANNNTPPRTAQVIDARIAADFERLKVRAARQQGKA